MDKLSMETPNLTVENIQKIEELFPNCIKESEDDEGNKIKKVDFDLLRAELGDKASVEGLDERYRLDWPGKKRSILKANTPITKTLRPIKEDSVDWDNTGNLYIEGDNFEVLKILQESYLGKIKMIYIDPPYNTGNDFIYDDDFSENSEEYRERIEENGEGYKMFRNTESNGRFHSDWLSMMYERLKIARDFLSDDGIIFTSIGQTEIHNLIGVFDEIFGEQNHVGTVSRVMKSGSAQGQFFSPNIEYILVYAKNINFAGNFREPISEEIIKKLYTSIETEGERKGEKFRPFGLYQASLDPLRGCVNQRYYIEAPDGELLLPPGNTMPTEEIDGASVTPKTHEDKVWRRSKERYLEEKKKGNILIKESNGTLINSEGKPAKWNVYSKIWLSDRQESGMVPVDLITKWENRQSKKELDLIKIPFDFAKPYELIKYLISIINDNKEAIILDFFSGSATTADAVMQINAEDGGNRKYIMVQLPEPTDEKSEAFKSGYKTICDIGKERIRRAGKKIKEETGADIDYGFRVYKVDESCMKDVYYHPSEAKQENLALFTSNIKDDRTPEDLLTQVILNFGLTLDLPIEEKFIGKNKVFYVAGNSLIACFDENIDDNVIDEIAKDEPIKLVFRDACFKNDAQRINVENKVKRVSPETIIKVI